MKESKDDLNAKKGKEKFCKYITMTKRSKGGSTLGGGEISIEFSRVKRWIWPKYRAYMKFSTNKTNLK